MKEEVLLSISNKYYIQQLLAEEANLYLLMYN